MDIAAPFDQCALRIRLVESTDTDDRVIGRAKIDFTSLEMDPSGTKVGMVERWINIPSPTSDALNGTEISPFADGAGTEEDRMKVATAYAVKIRMKVQRPEHKVRRLRPSDDILREDTAPNRNFKRLASKMQSLKELSLLKTVLAD